MYNQASDSISESAQLKLLKESWLWNLSNQDIMDTIFRMPGKLHTRSA